MPRTAPPPVAVEFAVTLTAVVRAEPEAGGYSASVPALPGCHTQSETIEEVTANLRDAAEGWLAVAHEDGLGSEAADESAAWQPSRGVSGGHQFAAPPT